MAGAAGRAARRTAGARRAVTRLIEVGATAPDFVAEASDGRTYALRELLTESRVMLAFYPGNDTPG